MKGSAVSKQKLLNVDANAKTVKGQDKGFLTGILYLAPGNLSGKQVCPMASPGCLAACLNTAGRGAFTTTQTARIKKTKYYFAERDAFMAQLHKEIGALIRKAERMDLLPCVRLNGTSDIVWERVPVAGQNNIMDCYPALPFYDYTKRHNRRDLPGNYHLTFSLAENNAEHAYRAFSNGLNVAIVYRNDIPRHGTIGPSATYGLHHCAPVLDGTEHDLRFLDTRGHIVGLCAKGRARYDTSGFIRD
jgi:hypothetical protein